MQPYLHHFFSIQMDSIAGVCALATSVAQLFSCLEGKHGLRERAHKATKQLLAAIE
jgi:hypothetical protein